MSVLEMKAIAFEKLAALKNENEIQEILEHLNKVTIAAQNKAYNLSKHYNTVADKYGEVLEKLAK